MEESNIKASLTPLCFCKQKSPPFFPSRIPWIIPRCRPLDIPRRRPGDGRVDQRPFFSPLSPAVRVFLPPLTESDPCLQLPPPVGGCMECSLTPAVPRAADPYLFGVNSLLGPMTNLAYDDPSLVAATRGIGVGAVRYPGGTLANFWSFAQEGYTREAKRDFDWVNAWDRTGSAPAGTFTPRRFWLGVGSASAPTGPVWVLNVLTLTLQEQLAEVELLRRHTLPVARVEIGNELYDYPEKFPRAGEYMRAILPVIRRVRKLFPDALIAVVGVHDTRGSWNSDLAEYAEYFDAVTMHPYEPTECAAQEWGGGDNEKSAVAAWGEGHIRQLRAHARSSMGHMNKQIWLTEFNVGWDCTGIPDVVSSGGAMLGLFWAGYVLAAIDTYNSDTPIRGLMYHIFEWQEDCDAGPEHLDCWGKGSQLVTLPPRESARAVQVGGPGQIFAHVSAVALRGETSRMRRVPLSSNQCGNILPVAPSDQGTLGCLSAAAFDSPTSATVSFVVLNRCVHDVNTSFEAAHLLRLPLGAQSWQLTTTAYSADDAGGFVPLPEDTSVLPWPDGPLSPTVTESEVGPDELSVQVTLERLSLTIATFSALVRYPIPPPSPPTHLPPPPPSPPHSPPSQPAPHSPPHVPTHTARKVTPRPPGDPPVPPQPRPLPPQPTPPAPSPHHSSPLQPALAPAFLLGSSALASALPVLVLLLLPFLTLGYCAKTWIGRMRKQGRARIATHDPEDEFKPIAVNMRGGTKKLSQAVRPSARPDRPSRRRGNRRRFAQLPADEHFSSDDATDTDHQAPVWLPIPSRPNRRSPAAFIATAPPSARTSPHFSRRGSLKAGVERSNESSTNSARHCQRACSSWVKAGAQGKRQPTAGGIGSSRKEGKARSELPCLPGALLAAPPVRPDALCQLTMLVRGHHREPVVERKPTRAALYDLD